MPLPRKTSARPQTPNPYRTSHRTELRRLVPHRRFAVRWLFQINIPQPYQLNLLIEIVVHHGIDSGGDEFLGLRLAKIFPGRDSIQQLPICILSEIGRLQMTRIEESAATAL